MKSIFWLQQKEQTNDYEVMKCFGKYIMKDTYIHVICKILFLLYCENNGLKYEVFRH